MVRLVPMTEVEFNAYLKYGPQDYAQEHIQAGNWSPSDALRLAWEQYNQLLPDGLATPNHYFYTIEDQAQAVVVGMLWFMVHDRAGRQEAFVCDIQIRGEYRRRGYGTAAFRALEDVVSDLGLPAIALHVFGHNHAARSMYEKLGFVTVDLVMAKALEAGG